MTCTVATKEIQDIRPTRILPQTPYWARLKDEQGYIPTAFELKVSRDLINPNDTTPSILSEDLLIFIRFIDQNHSYAYVPYGPKLEPRFENHGLFLEELSEALRSHLPHHCQFIRFDLLWENQWSDEDELYDEKGSWQGPPAPQTQEFRVNFNTSEWNLKKSPTDFLPKNTFFIDLSLSEEELLANMRYNTRYNIRRALREGINIQTFGIDKLDEWYQLYLDTSIRNNLTIQDKSFFAQVMKHQDETSRGVTVNLLMADYNGEFLASMFLVRSNQRSNYLYGASSSDKRHMMASYALQWEAIKIAKHSGCLEYDMFGCAPNLDRSHPLHGVHLYKKGFGGQLHHRMGCWDYPFDKKNYEWIKMKEMNEAI